MSLIGKPSQDLAVSNLAVSQTVSALTVSALNLNATTINAVSTDVAQWTINSVFTDAVLGGVVLQRGLVTFQLNGILNQSGAPLAADTTFAYIPNWPGGKDVFIPTFVYCPDAATIATAGFLTTATMHGATGTLTLGSALLMNDPANGFIRTHYDIKLGTK